MPIRILKVESLSLQSKKDNIKKFIINSYAEMLNSLQIPIQIICKSEKYNINNYLVNDKVLYDFIKKYSQENNIVNKTFYMIANHSNILLLNSTINTIQKYLKSMNIHYDEFRENKDYQWDNILSMTKTYVRDEQYYYKTLWIYDWPYYCQPGWLEFLYNTELNIDINCHITPQNTQQGIKFLKNRLIQFGANSELELERTNDEDIYSAEIGSIAMMLKELRNNLGKLFFTSYYITIKGKTVEELQGNFAITRNWLTSKSILTHDSYLYQHKSFINNVMDGKDELNKKYNFTTSSLKYFFPFQAHNICDRNGIYIGVNTLNKNLIFLDIFAREYAVILLLGIMGSGKSFLAKNLIKNLSKAGIEVTILDKSGEYAIFKDKDNIIVHSHKTFTEYAIITRNYIDMVNEDYIEEKIKPRIFIVDELWSYINNNDYVYEFNNMFTEMILEGRKKYMALGFISQLIESLSRSELGQVLMKTANIKFLMKMLWNEARLISKEFDLNMQQENFLTVVEDHEGLMLVNSNCVQFKVELEIKQTETYNTNPREAKII